MSTKKARRLPEWLLALGWQGLPSSITVQGQTCHLLGEFKHDFWAASGLYGTNDGKVVLKVYRRQDLLGVPMRWLGRYLAAREVDFYCRLQDLPGIPRMLGRVGPDGFVHEYIPGHTLLDHGPDGLSDDFFDQVIKLLGRLHQRGMSYIDTNKRDNIIVGDDGRPYLIDFQISWRPSPHGLFGLNRRMLRYMQRMDIYHVLKHKSRLRPDLMSPEEWKLRRNPGGILMLHRVFANLFRHVRRTNLRRLKKAHGA